MLFAGAANNWWERSPNINNSNNFNNVNTGGNPNNNNNANNSNALSFGFYEGLITWPDRVGESRKPCLFVEGEISRPAMENLHNPDSRANPICAGGRFLHGRKGWRSPAFMPGRISQQISARF